VNKLDRVRAALRGDHVDRVPASFWFHFPAAQAAGEAMANAHLRYYRYVDPDFLKVMNDNGYPGEINEVSDWRKLRVPSLSEPAFQNQLDGLKRIVDAIGHETLIITTIFNPFSTGNHISDRRVTEHMMHDPDAVGAGLRVIAEGLARFSGACLDAGASGIYFSAQGGERDRFSDELFYQHIKASDLMALQPIANRGEFHLLHICGYSLRLEAYADYPAHAVNWSPQWNNLSLTEGWRLLANMALVGGMDQRGPIVDGPREAIVAEAQEAIAQTGTRHFMLGAGCTLPNDVSWDHIRAAIAATALIPTN